MRFVPSVWLDLTKGSGSGLQFRPSVSESRSPPRSRPSPCSVDFTMSTEPQLKGRGRPKEPTQAEHRGDVQLRHRRRRQHSERRRGAPQFRLYSPGTPRESTPSVIGGQTTHHRRGGLAFPTVDRSPVERQSATAEPHVGLSVGAIMEFSLAARPESSAERAQRQAREGHSRRRARGPAPDPASRRRACRWRSGRIKRLRSARFLRRNATPSWETNSTISSARRTRPRKKRRRRRPR
jgi:hypothetical protein